MTEQQTNEISFEANPRNLPQNCVHFNNKTTTLTKSKSCKPTSHVEIEENLEALQACKKYYSLHSMLYVV